MRRIKPKDIQADSVEKLVCEPMSKLTVVELDKDTASIFIGFSIDPNGKEKAKEILKDIWIAAAIVKRMKIVFGRDLDPRVAIVIAVWAKSIGSAVMYMYYCQYVCVKNNLEGELTLDFMTENIFPMGMFTDEDMHKVWDGQKVDNSIEEFEGLPFGKGTDNLVDYGFAAQSLCAAVDAVEV